MPSDSPMAGRKDVSAAAAAASHSGPSARSAAGDEPAASACHGISFQMPWLSAAPQRRRSGGISGSALISCIQRSGFSYAASGRLGRLCLHSYVRRYARWSGHHDVGSCEP